MKKEIDNIKAFIEKVEDETDDPALLMWVAAAKRLIYLLQKKKDKSIPKEVICLEVVYQVAYVNGVETTLYYAGKLFDHDENKLIDNFHRWGELSEEYLKGGFSWY